MRVISSIFKLEVKNLYFSPIPWVTAALFALHSSYIFIELLTDNISQQELFGGNMGITRILFSSSQGIFKELLQFLFLYIPLPTMGIFSKEYHNETYKLLFSSPIKLRDILIGKYISVLSFFIVLICCLIPILLVAFFTIPHLDIGLISSGILGFFLLFSMYTAIGLFISSTTKYSILSAINTLVLLYLFSKIAEICRYSEYLRDIAFNLSISGRAESIIAGLLCTDDILYFCCITFLFILMTFLRLYFKQRRVPIFYQFGGYLVCFFIGALFLHLSHKPKCIHCYDATAEKRNTLSEQSINILKQIKEPIQITTYVNMADYLNWIAVPPSINEDKQRFRKYLRFKPDITMNYVYYEAEPIRNSDYNSPYRLPTASIAKVFCEANKMKYDELSHSWDIKNIDIKAEKNSLFRIIENPSLQTSAVLRVFDDMATHPSENEISLALKALYSPKIHLGFVSSCTDRTLKTSQEKGYGLAISETSNRYAIINQGFAISSIDIDKIDSIPQEIDILLVADLLLDKMSKHSLQILEKYIDKGKNLLLLLGKEQNLLQEKLLEKIGIIPTTPIILFPQKEIAPEIIPAYTLDLFSTKDEIFGKQSYCVMLPNAKALNYKLGTEFEAYPILQTNENQCVSLTSLQTKGINQNIQKYACYIPALALERRHNSNNQKIVVVDSSDFLANKELNTTRENYNGQNQAFFLDILRWLTDGKAPLKLTKKHTKDNLIKLTVKELDNLKFWILYPLSLGLLFFYVSLFIRRHRR